MLAIGIGGSALGPMFRWAMRSAIPRGPHGHPFHRQHDPDGIARALQTLKGQLRETLVIVTSKSGGTPDTRNGMVIVADEYRAADLDFSRHVVAVTMAVRQLDKLAASENWLARFPMFDWVGGRTSELSAVGLLPAALQGIDIDAMLTGAAACDAATRVHDTRRNPAALMALMWYAATEGKGKKDLVVLPYKDRLLLFSRYLQQLVMESLGKQLDLDGRRVEQGIAVYGNKGSTDQHAFVQQLRDGVNNFFVTIRPRPRVRRRAHRVEPGVTAGDYLSGFLTGTREALYGNDRQSMTIAIRRVDARIVGALIALFERAVGLYASLIHINAYNQPGVEQGRKPPPQSSACRQRRSSHYPTRRKPLTRLPPHRRRSIRRDHLSHPRTSVFKWPRQDGPQQRSRHAYVLSHLRVKGVSGLSPITPFFGSCQMNLLFPVVLTRDLTESTCVTLQLRLHA